MIKVVVFDKDGTLLDYDAFWVPVAREAIGIILKKIGLEEKNAEGFMQAIGAYSGISGVLCYGSFAEISDAFNKERSRIAAKLPPISDELLESAFKTAFSAGDLRPATENIVQVLQALRDSGYKTAVATSDNPELTEMCLKQLGIYGLFDKIYTCDGVLPHKPSKELMDIICRDFAVESGEVAMVGDTLNDVNFAKNGGALAIAVAKKQQDEEIVKKYADITLKDISYVERALKQC